MTENTRCAAVVGLIVLIGAGLLVYPLIMSAFESGPHHDYGLRRLQQIGAALRMYTADHEGRLPPSMGDLYPEYVSHRRVFVCQSDWDKANKLRDVVDPEEVRKLIEQGHSSFRYIGFLGDARAVKDPGKVLVAFGGLRAIHGSEGRAVLFLDSHTECVSSSTFERYLEDVLNRDDVSEEQKAYQRGFIDGMKAAAEMR